MPWLKENLFITKQIFHDVITEFKCNIHCQITCKFRVM